MTTEKHNIGFIASAWDLLHPGHLLALKYASIKCNTLFVGLHVDPSKERPWKNRPVQSVFDRWVQLRATKFVQDNEIIPYETEADLLNILTGFQIDVRFLGEDYLNIDSYTGSNLPMKVEFIPRQHKWSSSALRQQIMQGDA